MNQEEKINYYKKYGNVKVAQTSRNNTVQLIGIGHVLGTLAGELKVDDHIVWNYGSLSRVHKIVKETKCFVWIIEESIEDGKIWTDSPRRLKKSRIVGRPACELN